MKQSAFAMLFPGQGSQAVGMLKDFAADFPVVEQTFSQASEVLGMDLWRLVREGPADDLDQTQNTQPAMLAAGVAVWEVWRQRAGPRPAIMAGHSLGEYSALVCAGAVGFEDAVRLVAERGRLMQQAVPVGEGAMAAILGLDDAQVSALCREAAQGNVVEAANFNSPGQVVVAGHAQAVQRAIEGAKAAGAKRAVLLPVSVPSHCALMRPAAEALAERLQAISVGRPEIPVLHNVSGAVAASASEIRQLLARQMYSPVRWVETVRAMAAQGVTTLVEAGPGKVLSGLGKRIDRKLGAFAVSDGAALDAAMQALNHV